MKRLVIIALGALAGCATAAPAPTPPEPVPAGPVTAIRGARVFDGAVVYPSANVVFQGERIVAVGPDAAIPAGATVVDGTGKTVLPGLIDAHFHALNRWALAWALEFGVTSVVDLHTAPALYRFLRAQQAEHAFDQADFHSAGQLIEGAGGLHVKKGLGGFLEVTDAASCKAAVDAVVDEGAEWVKLSVDDGAMLGFPSPVMSPEVLRACIDAAHARGRLALVHAVDAKVYDLLADAGADGIVHAPFLNALEPATVRKLLSRNVFVIPTFAVVAPLAREDGPSRLAADPALQGYLAPLTGSDLAEAYPPDWGKGLTLELGRANVKALHEAGVALLAGDDAGPGPGEAVGSSLHAELEELVRVGLTPVEALRAATELSAQRLHLVEVGRLAPGMRADLLVVDGDPTTDITATRRIAAIFKRGRPFDREPLHARAQVEQAAYAAYVQKDYPGAANLVRGYLAQHPGDGPLTYALACFTQLAGQPGALELLKEALASDPWMAPMAARDDDLAGLRSNPDFQRLVAGGPAAPH